MKLKTSVVLIAGAFISMSSMAQQPSGSGTTSQPMARPGTAATGHSPNAGIGGSGAFSGWLSDYQSQNQGRVSRQAYMDEVGRRWDKADGNKQGLTTDQINETYGMGTTGMMNSSPGNMGPNNVKK